MLLLTLWTFLFIHVFSFVWIACKAKISQNWGVSHKSTALTLNYRSCFSKDNSVAVSLLMFCCTALMMMMMMLAEAAIDFPSSCILCSKDFSSVLTVCQQGAKQSQAFHIEGPQGCALVPFYWLAQATHAFPSNKLFVSAVIQNLIVRYFVLLVNVQITA